jgi:hypothetical protein
VITDGPSTNSNPSNANPGDPVGSVGTILMMIYLASIFVGLIYMQVALWASCDGQICVPAKISLAGIATYSVSYDTWILFLILTVGALGSFVHAATSFADYVGNQRLCRSWIVWFLLRPLIGSALAFVFYLVLRGGLFASAADPKSINIYGFAAIAAVAGLFSKQATDKLREVFDTLFKTSKGGGDDERRDPLNGSPAEN